MIELQNLTFGYRRKKPLISGLSLEMADGHIFGLLGSNGVGKSTLLKLLGGLLAPQDGTLAVLGQNPAERRPSLYRDLFFIPEEFDLPPVDFRTFARTTSSFYPFFSAEDLRSYEQIFEIDPLARLNALSMGQKKRALLAFALATNVSLLLMDEPTNGLDIPAKAVFRNQVAAYADEQRTVVLSTHQVRDVDSLIDHVLILDRSGLVLDASIDRITEKLYFGSVDGLPEPIYCEESLAGRTGVVENASGRESRVDLELLFQAATHNRERIDLIFKN